jgi:hypothetical protein
VRGLRAVISASSLAAINTESRMRACVSFPMRWPHALEQGL